MAHLPGSLTHMLAHVRDCQFHAPSHVAPLHRERAPHVRPPPTTGQQSFVLMLSRARALCRRSRHTHPCATLAWLIRTVIRDCILVPVRGTLLPLALSHACPPPCPASPSPTRAHVAWPPAPPNLTLLQCQPAIINRCNQFTCLHSSSRNGRSHHGHQWPQPLGL
jgi:hypothetical protein